MYEEKEKGSEKFSFVSAFAFAFASPPPSRPSLSLYIYINILHWVSYINCIMPYLIAVEYIHKYYIHLYHFNMDWYPQAPLTVFHDCRGHFPCLKSDMPLL